MDKMKEYITNKKIIILVVIIILMMSGGIYFVMQSSHTNPPKTEATTQQETIKTETKKDHASYVKGLKDWTVEVDVKNIDFMQEITFDKKVVKDVIVDASQVDLTKEGKYNLIYSIVPVDTTVGKKDVIKTIEVVSKETAQKEVDKGNQVVTSDNVIKKDSQKETTSQQNNSNKANSSHSQNTNSNISSNTNNSGSKPSTNNNSTSSTSHDSRPVEPDKSAHVHNFNIFVPEKSHTEYVTETYEEQVPKYVTISWYECNVCHKHFDNDVDAGDHCIFECGCNYTFKKDTVQDGYDIVTKTRKVPQTVVDKPAHYECSCGAQK